MTVFFCGGMMKLFGPIMLNSVATGSSVLLSINEVGYVHGSHVALYESSSGTYFLAVPALSGGEFLYLHCAPIQMYSSI